MKLWRVSHLSDYKLTRAFHTLPADGLQETKISQQQIRQVCFCLDSLTFLNILRTAPGLGGRLLIKGLRKNKGAETQPPPFFGNPNNAGLGLVTPVPETEEPFLHRLQHPTTQSVTFCLALLLFQLFLPHAKPGPLHQ